MRLLSFLLALVLVCEIVSAQDMSSQNFTLTAGYSRLSISNPNNLLLNKDGEFLDFDAAFRPSPGCPVLLGVGVGGSGFFRYEDVTFTSGGQQVTGNFNSRFLLFQIEPRLALPIVFGKDHGLYLEPRIGGGLLIEDDRFEMLTQSGGNGSITETQHTGLGVEIHPAIQAGYCWDGGAVGVEGSYVAGWGQLGMLDSREQELRVGAFFKLRI
jgi:hypothetical protein